MVVVGTIGLGCEHMYAVEPRGPVLEPGAERVQISRVVPEGCTDLGEVSATGTAANDPATATERARTLLRNRAFARGGNWILLEMQTGGATRTEAVLEPGLFGPRAVGSAELQTALWGRVFACPEAPLPPSVAENARCTRHDDCPAGQFCAPPGRCRRP
jgi:hypothetical protein